ncbi:helix-turn-helix domain-containing protein [Arthrobacter sp. CP30]
MTHQLARLLHRCSGVVLDLAGCVRKGRSRSLSPERAIELCEKAAAGVPKAVLAREYGISRETVYAYLRAGSGQKPEADPDGENTLRALIESMPADTRELPTVTPYDSLLSAPATTQNPPTR